MKKTLMKFFGLVTLCGAGLSALADVQGLPEGATRVSDGFYQSGATYGSSSDFYITSKAGLTFFSELVNEKVTTYQDKKFDYSSYPFAGKTVNLLADIDLEDEEWTPIGNQYDFMTQAEIPQKPMFGGTFDGNNHTISNLKINNVSYHDKDGAGLFGRVTSTAAFKNLTIENANVYAYSYAGALCGNAGNSTPKVVIDNVHLTGKVSVNGYGYVGGLCGHGLYTMTNCSVIDTASESGKGVVICRYWQGGGIGGTTRAGTSVTDCTVKNVDVQVRYYSAGGVIGNLAGSMSGCTVENVTIGAYNGSTSFDEEQCGMLVGALEGDDRFVTENSPKTAGQCGSSYKGTCVIGWDIVGELAAGGVTGGTFEALPDGYVGSGYMKKQLDTVPVTWEVVEKPPVAKIGEQTFKTLQAALATVPANNTEDVTIELLADIEIPNYINISKKHVAIEGNGFSIRPTADNTLGVWDTMVRLEGSDGIVFDNVVFDGLDHYIGLVGNGRNETYRNCQFINAQNCHYYGASQGVLTFEDCVISTAVYGINQGEGDATVIIRGCTISGWNSFGETETVRIYDTSFSKESSGYGVLRFYGDTVVSNVTIAADMDFVDGGDSIDNHVVYFIDCDYEAVSMVTDMEASPNVVFAFDATGNETDGFKAGMFVTKNSKSIPVAAGNIAKQVCDDIWTIVPAVVQPTEEEPKIEDRVVDENGKELSESALTPAQKTVVQEAVNEIKQQVQESLVSDPVVVGADTKMEETIAENRDAVVEALALDAQQKGIPPEQARDQIEEKINLLVAGEPTEDTSKYLSIQIGTLNAKVVVKETEATATPEVLVYEVKPIVKTVVTATVGGATVTEEVEAQLPNEAVRQNPITFILEVFDPKATRAMVKHTSDDEETFGVEVFDCPIWELGGKRYITITTSHFSTFEITYSSEIAVATAETIGIVKVEKNAAGDVAIAAPFLKSGVANEVNATVSELVVSGAAAGDTAKVWAAGAAAGDYVETVELDETTAVPGEAFWYSRAAAGVTLALGGLVDTNGVSSAAALSTEKGMTLFTNPFRDEVNVLAKMEGAPADGDQIVIEGSGTRYAFANDIWTSAVKGTSSGKATVRGANIDKPVTAIVVPAGKAFWYVSKGGAPVFKW